MKPRVLFVGRTRYRLPLSDALARKWDAVAAEVDLRVVGSAPSGAPATNGRFRLVPHRSLDGPRFYLGLPSLVVRELRSFRPDVVIAQSPYEAAAVLLGRRLSRSGARVVLDVHGDWRTFARLYGSPARRALGPLADRIAAAALRRADAVRTVSPYTTRLVRELGIEPAAVFPAFMDLEPFTERPPAPLPERPAALFVGVLEAYKNVDGLASAWRLAAPRVPAARLRIVGRGTMAPVVERLVAELPGQTDWTPALSPQEVAAALDDAWALVLPSRSEGMGRVVVETLCRGRAVVGSRVGGIPDLVEDGVSGLLVEPDDTQGIADALVRVLSDRAVAERLGAGADAAAGRLPTPEEYAVSVRALVELVV